MSDTPFDADEEAQLYEELGFSPDAIFANVSEETREHFAEMLDEAPPIEELTGPIDIEAMAKDTDERPNPADSIVVQVPDVSSIEFDDALIEHLDVSKPQERAEASRILFNKYGGAGLGIPKGTHRSNWNALIHQRISMHLGRRKAAAGQVERDSLQAKVSNTSAQKVADTAAISTQAALKVLKDQILTEEGEIDMARFAQLLKDA